MVGDSIKRRKGISSSRANSSDAKPSLTAKQRVEQFDEQGTPLPEELEALRDCLLAAMCDVEDLFGINLDPEKNVVIDRCANEGMGFLAKRLPEYADWVLRSIAKNGLQQPLPRFRHGKDTNRPAFMQKLLSSLFNSDGSVIQPENPAEVNFQGEVLKSILLLTNSFGKKYEVPLTGKQFDKQIDALFQFDEDQVVKVVTDMHRLSPWARSILEKARTLLNCVFNPEGGSAPAISDKKADPTQYWAKDPKFGFGPGAVVEGYAQHEKYVKFKMPPLVVSRNLGLRDIFTPSPGVSDPDNIILVENFTDKEREVWKASLDGGGVTSVRIVPKNYGKGRVISIMPSELMYVQQGYKNSIYEHVEAHPDTKGYVNFSDQTINQRLALTGVRDNWATLDMKNASDSVGNEHVTWLFPDHVANVLQSLRPSRMVAKKKDGTIVTKENINMYAPMGSALCFPTEALVFWAVARAAVLLAGAKGRSSEVYVYGDDIIVNSDYAEIVISALSECGFITNTEKSFTTGLFRESCGLYAFNGVECTIPFRLKKRLPIAGLRTKERYECVVAWVEYANLAEAAGFPKTAASIRKALKSAFPKSNSFPTTCDPDETKEGYLAFLCYDKPQKVRDLLKRESYIAPSPEYFWVAGSTTCPLLDGSEELPPGYGLGTYKSFTHSNLDQRGNYQLVGQKLLYAARDGMIKYPLSETTAYMRWVLERPEDVSAFSDGKFHIKRCRINFN